MRINRLIWTEQIILSLLIGACLSAQAELSSDALINVAYDSNAVDRRIPLTAVLNQHQVTVSMFVNRNSPSFDLDSKIAALNIAKALMDADMSITAVVAQFKSLQFNDFKEVFVGGGDVTAYSAGRKTRQEVLESLELKTIAIDYGQSQSGGNGQEAVGNGSLEGTSPSEFTNGGIKIASTMSGTAPGVPSTAGQSDKGTRTANKTASAPAPSPKDKLFIHERIAFWYPPNWFQRRVSPNQWATPDEHDVAEFVCKTRMGQPFISLSRFSRISLRERLRSESEIGAAFELEVTSPEETAIGYRGTVPATVVISTGRKGLLHFKRVYFHIGTDLYALTLRCKEAESSALERDFSRILSTVHTPVRKTSLVR